MKNLKPFLLIIFLVNTFTINAQNENSNDSIKIEKETTSQQLYKELYENEKNPLIIINGHIFGNSTIILSLINPNDIEKIDVIKKPIIDTTIIPFVSNKDTGVNGVLLISLKNKKINSVKKINKLYFFESKINTKKRIIISGTIYNSENKPIPNITISDLNRKESFKSDSNGNYSLIASKKDLLLFDLDGFDSKIIKVKESKLDIILISNSDIRIRG